MTFIKCLRSYRLESFIPTFLVYFVLLFGLEISTLIDSGYSITYATLVWIFILAFTLAFVFASVCVPVKETFCAKALLEYILTGDYPFCCNIPSFLKEFYDKVNLDVLKHLSYEQKKQLRDLLELAINAYYYDNDRELAKELLTRVIKLYKKYEMEYRQLLRRCYINKVNQIMEK